MDWTEITLAIVTTLLGGGNIIQWFQVRELRRKSSAEAYQSEINSLRTIIDGNVQEIKRLETSYGELQEKYFTLAKEFQVFKVSVLTERRAKRNAKQNAWKKETKAVSTAR